MRTTFHLEALPLDSITGELVRVDEPDAYPCRVCLTDAAVGEEVVLGRLTVGTGAYATSGPVFVHARGCTRHAGPGIPRAVARRLLAVRAHAADGRLLAGEVVPGAELAAHAERVLADPAVHELRVFHARAGCYACRIVRADAAGAA